MMFRTLLLLGLANAQPARPVCSLEKQQNSVYFPIYETQQPGSEIDVLPIQGRATGEEPEILLRLVSGFDYFALDPRRKVLTLKKAVDRDAGTTKLDATVECRSLLPHDNFKVNITVGALILDANDNAPVFGKSIYEVAISEELPIGTVILTDLHAVDYDQNGPHNTISYAIVEAKPYSNLLEIPNPGDGIVTVRNRIDFETLKNFSVKVKAQDDGKPPMEAFATIQVTVIDTDDMNPTFEYDAYNAFVDAGLHTNTNLTIRPAPFEANDGDTLSAPIIYSLSGRDADRFIIDAQTGEVKADGNFGSGETMVLLVQAHQRDRKERRTQANFRVIVTGENSNEPRFTKKTYTVEVAETTPVGSKLLQVTAVDPDVNTLLLYSLKDGSESNIFSMDEHSGDLVLASPLDFEQNNIFRLAVEATDGSKVAEADIQVIVLNSNDNSPVFSQTEYKFRPDGTTAYVGTVRAEDNDLNDQVKYKLLNFNEVFAIDKFGVIRVIQPAAVLNRTYELVVVAEDSGTPVGRSHATVTVDLHLGAHKLVLSTVNGDRHSSALIICLAGLLVALAVACTLLLICIFKLRHGRPKSAWRKQQWNAIPVGGKPYITEPIVMLPGPRANSALQQRYNQVPTASQVNEAVYQQPSSSNNSPHGSESPLQPRSERLQSNDRQLSVSYSSSAMFPPHLLQTDKMSVNGSQFRPKHSSDDVRRHGGTRPPVTVYF